MSCENFESVLSLVMVTNHVSWHRERLRSDRENREIENTI